MLRHHRVLTPVFKHSTSALGMQPRHFTDKVLIGSTSAFLSSLTTISLFHLIVTPVSSSIALGTIVTATASGSLCVIDGGEEGGTAFGTLVGVIMGAMGGFYMKSQKEPWRK